MRSRSLPAAWPPGAAAASRPHLSSTGVGQVSVNSCSLTQEEKDHAEEHGPAVSAEAPGGVDEWLGPSRSLHWSTSPAEALHRDGFRIRPFSALPVGVGCVFWSYLSTVSPGFPECLYTTLALATRPWWPLVESLAMPEQVGHLGACCRAGGFWEQPP